MSRDEFFKKKQEEAKAHRAALARADGEAIAVARGIAGTMLDSLLVGRAGDFQPEDWAAVEKLALLAYRREFPKSRGADLTVWTPLKVQTVVGRWAKGGWRPTGATVNHHSLGRRHCRFCREPLTDTITMGTVEAPFTRFHTVQCALEYLSGIRAGRLA